MNVMIYDASRLRKDEEDVMISKNVVLTSSQESLMGIIKFNLHFCAEKRLYVFSINDCQILMLRTRGLTWPFTMVARLHGMADLDSLHIATPERILFLKSFS